MKEKKARVEDALHATRAAVEEGIVPGGGVALIRAAAVLENVKASADEKVGLRILRRACEDPARWIASNAGEEASVVIDKIKAGKGAFGFNASSLEFGDMLKFGIVDPTKVVRCALQNAASIAGLLLTTEAVIADKPEEKKDMPGGGPGGGMPGMM
jgi:chaperonin GroEL